MLAKTNKTIKRVAFFGDAEAKSGDQHYKEAYEVAKLLAENGFTVVNGGGPGVMLASTLGAKAGKGRVEIVILDPKKQPDNYEGIDKENFNLADKKYVTGNYPNRLNKLVDVADAFVIFKGGTGTLSEVGLTWEMAKFEYGNHEPLIFMGDNWHDIITTISNELDLDNKEKKVYELVNTPEEVLEILIKRKGSKKVGVLEKFLKLVDNF
jgi:uncharacterized protein (TIGR00725 family)